MYRFVKFGGFVLFNGIDFFVPNEIIDHPMPKEENAPFLDNEYDDEDNLSW